jgi:malignant T-cell-amplified sequence
MSFKKFSQEEHVASMARVKASKARKILSAIKGEYSTLEDALDAMWPDKKTPVVIAELRSKTQLLVRDGMPIFFKPRDGRWVPSLRFLYAHPGILRAVRVDKGAIRFVLRGAACACGGLKTPASELPEGLVPGDPVAIFAEGKDLPLAVGVMTMSTEDIRAAAKGFAIEEIHYLDDALWTCSGLE